jgi:CRISPR-associated protein Cas6
MTVDAASPTDSAMLDLVFPLHGHALEPDPALALQQAVLQACPLLQNDARSGIHPLRLVRSGEQALLSQRSRLLLRVRRAQLPQLLVLSNQTLVLGPHQLLLGAGYVRELLPHTTLYAHSVASPAGADELGFMDWVVQQLQALQVQAHVVCGKQHMRLGPDGPLHAFSLMLHGLGSAQALRVLEQGLGPLRLLGCGLFVAHKSAAAVSDW